MTGGAAQPGLFTTPEARLARLAEIAMRHVQRDAACRILDLGCGSGGTLVELARRFQRATLVGLDISPTNADAARQLVDAEGLTRRVEVVAGDYLNVDVEAFDLIVADGILHLIEDADEALYGKLRQDLRPGGVLIASVPYDCRYNHALWRLRGAAARVRSPVVDKALLLGARLVHRGWDTALLAQRIPYMYSVPTRYDSAAMRTHAGAFGSLEFQAAEELPPTALGDAKHRVVVYRRCGE